MKLISFDPSSTCTGWAVFEPPERLVDCGKIVFSSGVGSIDRLGIIRTSVLDLFDRFKPLEAVVEIPSPRAWNRGGGYGLAVYGMAVGVVLAACWQKIAGVHTVTEDKWTARQTKAKRLFLVKGLYWNEYSQCSDPGLDIADAICLGNWFLANRRISSALKGARA